MSHITKKRGDNNVRQLLARDAKINRTYNECDSEGETSINMAPVETTITLDLEEGGTNPMRSTVSPTPSHPHPEGVPLDLGLSQPLVKYLTEMEKRLTLAINETNEIFRRDMERKFKLFRSDMEEELSKIENKLKADFQVEMGRMKENLKSEFQNELQQMENNLSDLKENQKRNEEAINEQKKVIRELHELKNEVEREKVKIEGIPLQNQIFLSGSAIPSPSVNEDTLTLAKNLIREKLKLTDKGLVVSAQRFGKLRQGDSQSDTRSKILIEVASQDVKNYLMKNSTVLKPSDFFLNELLTKTVNNVFYRMRQIKRETDQIASLFTRDGIIKVKKQKTGRAYDIQTEADMNKFLRDAGLEEHIRE